MAAEIDVRILVNENLEIISTQLSVAVQNSISYEAMDFILFDAFTTLAVKFQDKINHHKHTEN
jgi:hypothetical protein